MKLNTIIIIVLVGLFIWVLMNPGLFTKTEVYQVGPNCGNSVCDKNYNETYLNCPLDCAKCGNGICEFNKYPGEDFFTCPKDCHEGNHVCDAAYNETCKNSEDCPCNAGQFCGDYGCQNIPPEPVPEKSFWEQELFPIGEFKVTGLTLIIALASLLVLGFSVGK